MRVASPLALQQLLRLPLRLSTAQKTTDDVLVDLVPHDFSSDPSVSIRSRLAYCCSVWWCCEECHKADDNFL